MRWDTQDSRFPAAILFAYVLRASDVRAARRIDRVEQVIQNTTLAGAAAYPVLATALTELDLSPAVLDDRIAKQSVAYVLPLEGVRDLQRGPCGKVDNASAVYKPRRAVGR